MTVGGYIIFGLIALFIIIIGAVIAGALEVEKFGAVVTIVVCAVLVVGTFGGMRWYYGNTESGKRALKTQDSNFNAGIERRVEVYDVEGDLIREYEGRFDVTYDDDRILFDDENGKRHVIYYSTGNVIIDEIGEDDAS